MVSVSGVHARINIRAALQDSIQLDGERCFGGKNNATIRQESWQLFKKLKANYLVLGLDQYRQR